MASPEDSDEEYLDDPIQLIDFEQKRVSNLSDKRICEEYDQADSEGELFIQKTINNLQKNCFRNESSRTAISLPVTFFDIAQNVEHLNHCRPLIVKIVDCDKHPWYYKKHLRSDKRRDNEIVDVGVEDYFQPDNKNNCSDKCENSEEMHNQQSRPKIRPVETPYEVLKNVNTTGKPPSPKTEILLKDWQKVIKQKAIDQRNDLQVDFRKNLGLIGLKISHTTETIKTQKKEKRSKKDKNKPNLKYADADSKKTKHDTSIMQVKNAKIFKDDDAKESHKLCETQNSDVAPVKSRPPDLIKHPVSVQESSAQKIPDCLQKVSDGINLVVPHNAAVTPLNPLKSGLISLEKISENVSLAKSVPTVLKKSALSATLDKGQLTASPCSLSQSNDVTPTSSVSNRLLKLPPTINVAPAASKMTNLPKLPDLTISSSKNATNNLPKLPEAVNNTLFKNTSSTKLPRSPESMNVIDNSNKNISNVVHSHFFSEMQREKQKLTPIKEKIKRFDEVQEKQSNVNLTPTKAKDKNKTLISILNKKVLNNDNIDQPYSVEYVQNGHKSDKTKIKIVKSKVAEKSNPSGGKKNNDILKMKLFKPQKKGNKNKGTRFTEFKETFLNDRKMNEVTCSTETVEVVNGKNEKGKVVHRSNASESAILQDECKQTLIVKPAIKSSPVTPINDKKVKLLSSQIVENTANLVKVAPKGTNQDMEMINNVVSNSFAQNCITQNNTQSEIMASAPQVPQTAINNRQNTIKTAPPLYFQTQPENMPVKVVGHWVPKSQKSTIPNNMVTSNNLTQNTQNGHKTSKVSCINVTISASPSVPQASVQCTTAQMQSSMNSNTKSLDTGIAPRTISKQQKQSLNSPFVVKMRETIPCHLNIPPQTKGNNKVISVRRKSVSALSEDKVKILEAYNNLMRLNTFPQDTSRPASTLNVNAQVNLTAPMQPYATLNPYNPNSLRPKTHPNTNLISPRQNKQSRREVNLQDDLQQVVNPGVSHLKNSPMLFNLNAAAQQIMPQQKKQQFQIGKLGALQQNKVLPTLQQNVTSNSQSTVQPTAEFTPEQLRSPLWTDNPRQQAIRHPLPPTCDVAPPQIVRNSQHPNELLQASPTIKLPNFNVPPPNVHAMHASKQGMVPQPIPVLQRNIQPEYRPDMNPHFVSNQFPGSAQNNLPFQHQAYSQQFIQQNRGIDYLNSRHCAPIYDNVPQNVSVNTVPYMQTGWNYYYPNMMMPPPPPPYTPQHNFKQNAKYVFIDPHQVRNQQAQKSVAGTTVIGCNDTGLVRKININSSTVDTVQDPIDRHMSTDNKPVPIGSDIEKPVASKKEMMEELNRETAIISPPAVLGVLKFCTEKENKFSNSVEDNSHSVTVDEKLNTLAVKNNSQTNNFSSPKKGPIFETNVVTDNVIAKESINKSPYNSVRENAPLIHESIPNSYEIEKSSEQVLKTPTSSSSPNIEKNVNNVIKKSSAISNKEDLKRPLPELDTVAKAVTSQTFIKRPKPGPLSRKPKFNSVSNAQIPVEANTVAHKGYSPPILPIPSYTKSLELLAQSNHESELRNVVDFAENQFKQPDIPETGSKKNLTEKEKELEEKAVKRISLHEYKKRDLKCGSKEEMREVKLEVKNETHDQDLGYDSDSTMRL